MIIPGSQGEFETPDLEKCLSKYIILKRGARMFRARRQFRQEKWRCTVFGPIFLQAEQLALLRRKSILALLWQLLHHKHERFQNPDPSYILNKIWGIIYEIENLSLETFTNIFIFINYVNLYHQIQKKGFLWSFYFRHFKWKKIWDITYCH